MHIQAHTDINTCIYIYNAYHLFKYVEEWSTDKIVGLICTGK